MLFKVIFCRSREEIQARVQGEIERTSRDHSKIIDDDQKLLIKETKPKPTFAFIRYIEIKSKEIFWLTLYTLVLWGIFAERAYCNLFYSTI